MKPLDFFCISVLISVLIIIAGRMIFQSASTRSTHSKPPPLVIFGDFTVDLRFILEKKNITHEYGPTDNQKKLTWKQRIHEFLGRASPHFNNRSICADRWIVVTDFSDRTMQSSKLLPHWCTVIVVGDQEYPTDVPINTFILNRAVQYELATISTFYKEALMLSKLNHMVRKNLGYLWAIFHDAKFIWDIDSDTKVFINETNFLLPVNETVDAQTVPNHDGLLFNPYSYVNSHAGAQWPRGYPLLSINNSAPQKISGQTVLGVWPTRKLGIINSLIENNINGNGRYPPIEIVLPPINLTNTTNNIKKDVKLIVPRRTFSPYDKQATLHLQQALWALYLPMMVHFHVSDIFRSYVMQRLMWDVDLRIAFASSYFIKEEMAHGKYRGDEKHYMNIDYLIQFIRGWSSTKTNLPERMEELFITLYNRSFIDLIDAHLVQLWIRELYQIGYKFPDIV